MNIYLVRHGETEDNGKGVYYGKKDSSLNSKGREQSGTVAQFLNQINFSKVFLSEKKRTKETADIIFKEKNSTYIIDNRINEMNMGIFEGKSYKQLENEYPKHWKEWCDDWTGFQLPQGESFQNFYNRVVDFIQEIKDLKDENILIVAHGGVVKSFYTYVMGGDLDVFWKFSTRNCDVSCIKYEYGNMYIDYIMPILKK